MAYTTFEKTNRNVSHLGFGGPPAGLKNDLEHHLTFVQFITTIREQTV